MTEKSQRCCSGENSSHRATLLRCHRRIRARAALFSLAGSLKASTPAAAGYFAWGCFRYFGLWRGFGISPSSLSLRSSYAGHHASPLRPRVAAPRVARRAKRGGPGRTRTCNQTAMSGRKSTGFVDFAVFLFAFDRVRCVSTRFVSGAKLVRSATAARHHSC